MLFDLNYSSGKPVYLQIVDQVKSAAASGALRVGEPLPSIRPLAEQLRVNRNTIAKAYEELEQQGVIEVRPGKGCYISGNHSPLRKEARIEKLRNEIDEAVVQAHHLQIDREEFLRLAEERFDHIAGKREQNQAHEHESSSH
jgi:GntR family transcriptional regulator